MRIGFDLRPAWASNSRHRGIGKYTLQLAEALSRANQKHELFFLGTSDQPFPDWALPGVQMRRIRRPSRLNWLLDCWQLPRVSKKLELDLFEALDITSIPAKGPARIWAHVHDLIPYLFWNRIRKGTPWDFRLALQIARRRFSRADLLIAPSVHSQKDIYQHIGLAEDRVRVIYPACHPRFRPLDPSLSRSLLKTRYSLSGEFLFYVGGSDYRKNLPRLIKAFAHLRDAGFKGKLVLAGESFRWNIPETLELDSLARELGILDRLVCPGFVPDEDLPHFYVACHAFVFPSLYEGFGLPLLEAIECGSVAATSRTSSLPEVGGEAVEYFDPTQVESIFEALKVVCFDNDRRAVLRREALRQRGRFSWDQAARELLELYELAQE